METSEQRGAEGHTAKKTELVESGWDRQESERQAEHRASAVKVSDGPIRHVGLSQLGILHPIRPSLLADPATPTRNPARKRPALSQP